MTDTPKNRYRAHVGLPPENAAAKVGKTKDYFADAMILGKEAEHATIERCAQAAALATLVLGDATATRANAVATIRALKDKR